MCKPCLEGVPTIKCHGQILGKEANQHDRQLYLPKANMNLSFEGPVEDLSLIELYQGSCLPWELLFSVSALGQALATNEVDASWLSSMATHFVLDPVKCRTSAS